MKYARSRTVSSDASPDVAGSACGDAEIRAIPAVVSFVAVGLRGFLVVVTRRPLERFPVFFVLLGPPDSGDG
jgi:hypothetical protein